MQAKLLSNTVQRQKQQQLGRQSAAAGCDPAQSTFSLEKLDESTALTNQ